MLTTTLRTRSVATLTLALALFGVLGLKSAEGAPDWPASRVRTDNDRIAEVIEYALKRSPSFGDLVATLETLDRIVYVQEGTCHHGAIRGCLQLLPTPGGHHLLVKIDPRQPIRSVVAQLAHELYHALEVAREADIQDEAMLRTLYERIGDRSCSDGPNDCFETRAAIAFEALVLRQLAGSSERSQELR